MLKKCKSCGDKAKHLNRSYLFDGDICETCNFKHEIPYRLQKQKLTSKILTWENVSTNPINNPVYEITIIENGKTFLQDFGTHLTEELLKSTEEFVKSGEYLNDDDE